MCLLFLEVVVSAISSDTVMSAIPMSTPCCVVWSSYAVIIDTECVCLSMVWGVLSTIAQFPMHTCQSVNESSHWSIGQLTCGNDSEPLTNQYSASLMQVCCACSRVLITECHAYIPGGSLFAQPAPCSPSGCVNLIYIH